MLIPLQLAWVIAFISFIVSAVQEVPEDERVNKFGWWSGVYALFLNIIVFVVVASDTIHTYHVAVSSYCAVGLVLSSVAIQNLIYWPIGSRQASAAGFVLLAIIQVREPFLSQGCGPC
jgi:SHO1 osmosensor